MEIDFCTGQPVDRPIGTTTLIAGQVRNKFEWRGGRGLSDTYTREYRITASTAALTRLPNHPSITAGQYVMPVSEWIQPELTSPGLPPIANIFLSLQHLSKGLGKDEDGVLWGPLNPFPQTLQGGQTNPLPQPNCPTAPDPTSPTPSPSATPTPTGPPPPPVVEIITIEAFSWVNSQSGSLAVTCKDTITDNTKVNMRLDIQQPGGLLANQIMTPQGGGVWQFNARSLKTRPTRITCKSQSGVSTGQNI
jgi:hypothetical protein